MSLTQQDNTPEKEKPTGQQHTFASISQLILIILLSISFLMITQQFSKDIYYWGVLSLVVLTLFQIAFGNIPPSSNWKTSLMGVVIAAVIIGALVFVSIQLVPTLLQIGR